MITTKKGDLGQTTCGDRRVDKDDLLVEVVGFIDEFQSVLELIEADEKIIDDLSQIMGELACDIKFEKYDLRIKWMEGEIEKIPKFDSFLKFKGRKSLEFNWARTVCRRVERKMVTLDKERKINKDILKYFNRLSDYLFFKAVEEIKK